MGLDEWLAHELVYLIETYPQLGDRLVTTADIWPIACILSEKSNDLIELLERYKQERSALEHDGGLNGGYSRSEEPDAEQAAGVEGTIQSWPENFHWRHSRS